MRLSVLCWFFADAAGLRRHQSFAWLSRELTAALARGQCLSCSWRLVCSSVRGAASGPVCSSWSSSGFEAVALPPSARHRLAPASTVVAWGEWFFLRWGSMRLTLCSAQCRSTIDAEQRDTTGALREAPCAPRSALSPPRRTARVRRRACRRWPQRCASTTAHPSRPTPTRAWHPSAALLLRWASRSLDDEVG